MLDHSLVAPSVQIREAAQLIQVAEIKILLVCDESRRLLGTLTDGDIRRAVSEGIDLNSGVETIMNTSPKVARPNDNLGSLRAFMRVSVIRHLPRLDEAGRVIGLMVLDRLEALAVQPGAVVLMAGGRGSRLMPLTKDKPKPLLPVGGKPVIERQIEQLIQHGFRRFYISVNYLGNMLEAHFGDGSRLGIEITYLREDKPLGTAGALARINGETAPIIVMNGDIISKTDFSNMMSYFLEGHVDATVGVREHLYTVPFGCVALREGGLVAGIEEKPSFRHLINAGIYVLSPSALAHVPKDEFFDMPQLLQALVDENRRVNTYQITEEWIDIGQKEDLLWAQKLFAIEDSFDS